MLRVEIASRDGAVEIRRYERDVRIGRALDNDLVLPRGNVSHHHARVVQRDQLAIVVDLGSTNGTWVNGRRLSSPLVVRDHDRIVIGDFALRVSASDAEELEPTLELDVTEQRLLAAMMAHEAGSREVYADWLEERGDAARAEFLRLQDTLATLPRGPHEHEARARVRALGPGIDARWRLEVVRPVIENCGRDRECPRDWGSLEATRSRDVRACPACACLVYFCRDFYEARTHARLGPRVVVDPVVARAADEPTLLPEDGEGERLAAPTAEIQVPPES